VTGRGDAFFTAFASQGIALAAGTAVYYVVKSRMPGQKMEAPAVEHQ
jgi:hypothetical protein